MFLDRKSQHQKFNMIPIKIPTEWFVTKKSDEVYVKKINFNQEQSKMKKRKQ